MKRKTILTLLLIFSIFYLWFAARTVRIALVNPVSLSYQLYFSSYDRTAEQIKTLTCDLDPRLGYYPGDPLIYFSTGLNPVSRYLYLWPWIAEIGLHDIITDLDSGNAIVYIDREKEIWGFPVREYLGDLITYLDKNYVNVGDFYLSPDLASRCGISLTVKLNST